MIGISCQHLGYSKKSLLLVKIINLVKVNQGRKKRPPVETEEL